MMPMRDFKMVPFAVSCEHAGPLVISLGDMMNF